jgi:hypothetical protein
MERLAAMTGVKLPFGKGRDLFEALTLVSLSDQTLDKVSQAYGATVARREQAWHTEACDQEALQRHKQVERRPLAAHRRLARPVERRGQPFCLG